jgi:hypothetical protein
MSAFFKPSARFRRMNLKILAIHETRYELVG